ncbi:MAG: NADH:ubiquinone oxidoreductase [Desulfomonilaceae bacterium]
MPNWVFMGLKSGVKTTTYPNIPETSPGVTPGRPREVFINDPSDQIAIVNMCPTGAIHVADNRALVDYSRCIQCFRCLRRPGQNLDHEPTYEWALGSGAGKSSTNMGRAFTRSIHIRMVDAGACRACLSEIEQLGKPYYNIHRLGFFMTPTPRHADVLLVAGPGTDNMKLALQKAYEAMPTPKKVIAVGACALSGGIFGPSFVSSGGIEELIPVDVAVPGCPPPPLAVIHGLLALVGRESLGTNEWAPLRNWSATR